MMIAFLMFLSCGEKETEDTASINTIEEQEETDTEEDTGLIDEFELYTLDEGIWAYTWLDITDNGCDFSEEMQQSVIQNILSARHDVRRVIEQNYVITLLIDENTEYPSSCINEENQLICDDTVFEIPVDSSVVTETYVSSGVITGSTRVEGSFTKYHSCEGDECDQIGLANEVPFPCDVTFDYVFSFIQ